MNTDLSPRFITDLYLAAAPCTMKNFSDKEEWKKTEKNKDKNTPSFIFIRDIRHFPIN